MKKTLCCSATIFYLSYIILSSLPTIVGGLGSSSTIAVIYGSSTVCGILAQGIQCFQGGQTFSIQPNISYGSISGGRDFLCALTSNGSDLFCWDTRLEMIKFVHHNVTSPLTKLIVGNDQVCALQSRTGILHCWRRGRSRNQSLPEGGIPFLTITSGEGFSCGIVKDDRNVLCWGESGMGDFIESQLGDMPMLSLVAGKSHVCGISMSGILICEGGNDSGQLDIPLNAPFHFSELALGGNYTCALQRSNGSVVCWGGEISDFRVQSLSFESIAAGKDFTCGLISETLSITCWGWGGVWSSKLNDTSIHTRKSEVTQPISSPPLEIEKKKYRPVWAYEIFGMVGIVFGLSACCYFVYLRRRSGSSDDNVKEMINNNESAMVTSLASSAPESRSSSITQVTLGRERSWDQSSIFTLYELALATENFSLEKKIGKGSFGTVYKGRLGDGREVAIKREEIRTRKERQRDNGFESELSLLSRVHHKHLVGLVGFCEESNERVLVYEYMSNGALYDHLHKNRNTEMNSWKMRIKIALDAARGIEYLHNYAVPPIIHRDIKTSNILLDSKWVARVSDFGLSLKGPEGEECSMPIKAVGTVGYIDPEYYVLKVLTTKSDVYGFGVVLLELVTGKRAVFKEVQGWGPTGVVDFAGPFIVAGQVWKVLDDRVEKPVMNNECEAVDILAYTAMMCVNLEGKQRPTMSNVVSNLERALALCRGTSSTFSPTSYSYK